MNYELRAMNEELRIMSDEDFDCLSSGQAARGICASITAIRFGVDFLSQLTWHKKPKPRLGVGGALIMGGYN
jgi:hypothetical protein